MAEARKSYMTKEQLEQYLADLRNNRPHRPSGSRPISSTAKSRWSLIRSSTAPPAPPNAASNPTVADPTSPPSLHGAVPSPNLTRRESKLLRKHSAPSHKRSSTASSLLGFVKTPSKLGDGESGIGGSRANFSRNSSVQKKRESAPPSFRGFSYTSGLVGGHGRTHSISSGSSSSSGNSERKKRVSWKLPGTSLSDPPAIKMPPCHPLNAADAPKIEKELALHFESLATQDALPTVAPLRINKGSSPTRNSISEQRESIPVVLERSTVLPSPAPRGRREYGAPYPRRPEYVEPWKQEPTQNNNPKYTTNPDPLPSPPISSSDDEEGEAEILKGLGRKPLPKAGGSSGPRGPTPEEVAPVRKNNTKYGGQVQPPPPPVIGIVTAPSPPPMSAPKITVSKANISPAIPTISFPDDNDNPSKGPTINVSGPESTPAVPTISVSDRNKAPPPVPTISAVDASNATRPGARPLPQPRGTRPSSVYSSASTAGRTRGATATCNLCRTHIEGRIVAAGTLRFHPECFRCDHCQTSLEHVGFYPEPKEHRSKRLEKAGIAEDNSNGTGVRFYCHLDFHELFSPRCKNCKTPIEGEVVVACGNTWHQGHFFCAECGDPFDSKSKFVEKDGYAWCVGCYTKRYSGRCKKCKRPVTETVVKALGGEWHEECFVCTECGCGFDDGRFFVRGGEGREVPACVRCEERRLKA